MMADLDARFLVYADLFDILGIISIGFLILIAMETVWDILTGRRGKIRETLANAAIAVGNFLLDRTVFGLSFIIGLSVTSALAFFIIPLTWWSWVLAVIAADFTYYWMHRIEHETRILWAYHSVHHSSPEYNLTTSLRLSWAEGLFEWMFFVPMILLGFDLVQTFAALLIVVIYQTWPHTEKIGKLGWADRVFNTPSVHRVHHGSNGDFLDKNYGGILIIWDRMFGTYQVEDAKVIYGVIDPIRSSNPFVINFHEYWQLLKNIRRASTFGDVFGYLFRKPGWVPGSDGENAKPD
jgi:sterol desaturase/sphingolipid hydroxylase (fatty acid hydroxylase superfamily)